MRVSASRPESFIWFACQTKGKAGEKTQEEGITSIEEEAPSKSKSFEDIWYKLKAMIWKRRVRAEVPEDAIGGNLIRQIDCGSWSLERH